MAESWRDNFKSSSLRVGFKLGLTRAMCEFLSAIADGVHWNRSSLGGASPDPDNFIATGRALVIRGLIEVDPAKLAAMQHRRGVTSFDIWSWTHYRLTPAGVHVVELLKLAGMYIEADIAVEKKLKEARVSK